MSGVEKGIYGEKNTAALNLALIHDRGAVRYVILSDGLDTAGLNDGGIPGKSLKDRGSIENTVLIFDDALISPVTPDGLESTGNKEETDTESAEQNESAVSMIC